MSDLYIDNVWHRHSSKTYKSIKGTLSANYSGLRLNVSFSGSTFSNYQLSGGGYPATGNQDTIRIFIDDEQVAETKVNMNSSTPNIYISGYRDVSTTSHNVYMTIQCGDYISCPYNYYHNPCNLGNISMPSPYKAPTISFRGNNALTPISRVDDGSWTVNYSVTSPTGATIYDTGIDIMVFGTADNVLQNHSFGTAVGDRQSSFTIKSSGTNIKDGMKFTTRLYVNDRDNNGTEHYNHNSGSNLTTRTYLKPIMTGITDFKDIPFSPQDNKKLQWTTNCNKWSANNLEKAFETTIAKGRNNDVYLDDSKLEQKIPQNPFNIRDGESYSTSNNCSYTITKTMLDNLFTDNERSVSVMDGVLRVNRNNKSAYKEDGSPYTAWATTTIKIQYQPTKSPTNGTVTYNNKSISRNTIFIQDIPTIDIDWSYPITSGAAGVVDGYILRVYSDSGYTQQYGKDKVIQVTQNASKATWKLNTKTELKRGVLNYLKITPYYKKPNRSDVTNSASRIEGQKSLQMALVTPISRINTPVIKYPINNSNWHNKNFRILLQLPSDDDISELGLSNNEYRYQDIELKITPNNMSANAVTYSFKNNPEIFSTDTLSHTKKIAINPSVLDTLPNASTYKLELRVQKNYYITTGENSYSKWSTAVIVKNTALNNLNLTSGQEIELSHYDYVRNASVRLHDTYPIYTLNSNNVSQKVGDQIDYKEYDGMITDILNIQKGVNEYCSYDQDRNDIKFQNTINTLNGEQEYITAELEGTEIDGRNYMNILINEMNKLI